MSITVTDELLKVPVAAQRLTVSEKCVWSWIAQGRLGIVRLGRSVRVPQSEITRVVQSGFQPAKQIA
jgi:excisionase family DNA binding protein